TQTLLDRQGQQYYEGVHQSRPVRAVRFIDAMQIDGLSGNFTVTVWQDRQHRNALVRDFVEGTLLATGVLVLAVALIVWFGVRLGLRPLADLEDAIARRSSTDLARIERGVPAEVTGIVRRLNRLFEQVAGSMSQQLDFISNAAHQLRNPIAGVLSLAEAIDSAPTEEKAKQRSKDLLRAAREAAELSDKLLLLERAKALSGPTGTAGFDLSRAVEAWLEEAKEGFPGRVQLQPDIEPGIEVIGDPTLLREAVRNLIDNALLHGGARLTKVAVSCRRAHGGVSISVRDDGQGMAAADIPRAFQRFALVGPTSRTGLGVSIVDTIARGHGGQLEIASPGAGLVAEMRLPL
ncbi:MAG: HAMP domain-containing sensor histidine kinase, partial [Pseudomonadota bacterium]